MVLLPLAPQASASANSATLARVLVPRVYARKFCRLACPLRKHCKNLFDIFAIRFGTKFAKGKFWLPELDVRRTSYPQEVHLLVKITIRRFKRGFIYLGNRPV